MREMVSGLLDVNTRACVPLADALQSLTQEWREPLDDHGKEVVAFVVRVRARLLIFSLPSPLNPHHLAGWQYKERSFRKTLFNPLDKHINATTRASPPLVATITCPEKSDTRSASNAVGPCAVVLSVSTSGVFPR